MTTPPPWGAEVPLCLKYDERIGTGSFLKIYYYISDPYSFNTNLDPAYSKSWKTYPD